MQMGLGFCESVVVSILQSPYFFSENIFWTLPVDVGKREDFYWGGGH